MSTLQNIRSRIVPVPQKLEALDGKGLTLTPRSKFHLSAPTAEKGPVKTAGEKITAFFQEKCGSDCFCDDGIPVTLELGNAPAGIKNETEGYRLTVTNQSVIITGFGPSGLFYGVVTFTQLCKWDTQGAQLPALEILDWPDNPLRVYKEECRYGSNMMEKADWFEMIDDLASKKINNLSLALYGCWVIQYDGRVAEYLYLPLREYPQLKTPQIVKYYSPSEDRWFDYETLPPIYRDNFLGDVIRYAKDRGIDTIPGINSFGHNTLFPNKIPAVSPVDENGNPTKNGFCTTSEETTRLLFSVYDQIIDDYLIPNDIHKFNILLDEVWSLKGVDAEDPFSERSAWCKCEKCRGKDKGDIYIDWAIKLISHLKEKGMTTVFMAADMVARKVSKLGYLGDKLMAKINEAGLADTLLLGWWRYTDLKEQIDFSVHPNELGLRSTFNPWNGYYIWNVLYHPMRNIKLLADYGRTCKDSEGFNIYALWDRSYDRIHDCFADYAWNYKGAGELEDVTNRYIARHFAPMQRQAKHAYRLMEWITEQRKINKDPENPRDTILSNIAVLSKDLGYYFYCYLRADTQYPGRFPRQALQKILPFRMDYERVMFSVASMAKEAIEIFKTAAVTPGCDHSMADRMAYECENYLCLVQDWLTLLEIYDLTQGGDQKQIAPLARERQQARLALMAHCEKVKELWACQGATMRNHSLFMQMFTDIATYVETTDDPQLDLMDITPIASQRLQSLR